MESPVPFLISLMLVAGVSYQLFFRYEHWTGGEHREVTYERDNLTGETHQVRPGDRIDFWARFLGSENIRKKHKKHRDDEENDSDDAVTMNMIADPAARRKADTREAPVPKASDVDDSLGTTASAVSRTVQGTEDLNGDGAVESIIQSKTTNDGLLDISVVSGGKELFYGRGKELQVLSSRRSGWSDLALKGDGKDKLLFRYNSAVEGYEAVDPE